MPAATWCPSQATPDNPLVSWAGYALIAAWTAERDRVLGNGLATGGRLGDFGVPPPRLAVTSASRSAAANARLKHAIPPFPGHAISFIGGR
jgi:hypothetical protein